MDVTLEAFITNLGKYTEGVLRGESLRFPTTTEEVQALLKRIDVDGVRYEEVIATEFDSNLSGFCDCLNQYDPIDELNYLTHLLSGLSTENLKTFQAVIEYGEHNDSAADLINLAQNLECYEFFPNVESAKELGHIYVDDMGALDVPEHLKGYFNYEAYGQDVSREEQGYFAQDGYLRYMGGFEEHYHDTGDIPKEHRVFAFPELSIRERMAAYKEVGDKAAPHSEKAAPTIKREER